jgi:polysaccharide biosynthesis protein PelG
MAGIGFELRKLFSHEGILANLRAYGYAGIVCTGPMLLSVAMLLGIRTVADMGGAGKQDQDLLVVMITYTLLASLVISSLFSMVITRFTADMLYINKPQWILPSFYGSLSILFVIGNIVYGVFLLLSGIQPLYQLLCLILFDELIVVWSQVNYMTAIKDYRSILLFFAAGMAIAVACGFLFVWLNFEVISALLCAVIIGYGIMMSGFFVLMHRHFPKGQGNIFRFLEWIDRFPSLLLVGLFLTFGLFSHLVIIWFSPIGVQVEGLFYSAPRYDIPAFVAFLSTLATMINFVTSVEVKFYPKYKQYFNLFNNGGSVKDIDLAEGEMLTVLKQELNYLALKQIVLTILFIVIGSQVLLGSGLGFDASMLGTFRILCIGYGLYAIGNSVMLIQLYFADNAGALLTSLLFMVLGIAGTLALVNGSQNYYGFGFLVGGIAMYLVAWVRLWSFTGKLQYHILCSQPVLLQERKGMFTKLSQIMQLHVERKESYENTTAKKNYIKVQKITKMD